MPHNGVQHHKEDGFVVSWALLGGVVTLIILLGFLSGASDTYSQVSKNKEDHKSHVEEFKRFVEQQKKLEKSIVRIEANQENAKEDVIEMKNDQKEVLRILSTIQIRNGQ